MAVERPEPWVISDETNGDPAEAGKSQCVASWGVDRAELGRPRHVVAIAFTQNPEYVPMKMESASELSIKRL